jgi:hypothetical protein
MIFPIWTLESLKSTFETDHDQRVIIKFLWNEGASAREIAARLQKQFSEYDYQLRTV